jgi:hypothetical protein
LGPESRVVSSQIKKKKAKNLLTLHDFGGQKRYSTVSFNLSWPSFPPFAARVVAWPPMHIRHPFFLSCLFSSRYSWLPSTFSYYPSSYFPFDFVLDFFISLCFILIHFSNFVLFSITSFFIFFIYQIWSSFF